MLRVPLWWFRTLSLLSLFLTASARPARAGEPSGVAEAADAANAIDLAKRHFQSASAYFEEARFDDAAREFRESYRLAPRVDLLYNIAQCYLRKGDAARAIDFFEQYLKGRPEAPDRAAVERTMAELRTHVGTVRVEGAPEGAEISVAGFVAGRAPLPGPVVVTAGKVRVEAREADGTVRGVDVKVPPDEEVRAVIPPPPVVVREKVVERVVERSTPRWWDSKPGWILAGAGLALAAAGGVMAGPVTDAVGDGAAGAMSEGEWRRVRDQANAVRDAGIGVAAAGGAAIVAGAVFFVVHGRRAAQAPPPVSVLVAPTADGAALVAAGRF